MYSETISTKHTSNRNKRRKKEREVKINKEREEKAKKEKQEQLERKIQRDIFNYLEKKYDEIFITDEFSYFTMSDTNAEAFFRLSCERLPSARIEVTGIRNADGTFDYTDNFEDGKKYN